MIVPLFLLAFQAAAPAAHTPKPCDTYTQNVWDPRFNPGQRWTYRTRPVDAGSTLTITKIDDVPGIGLVVQIDVDNVDFVDPAANPEFRHFTTQHFAIKRDSLDASVLNMLQIVTLPYDPLTYKWWHNDCVARTYSSTVADTLWLLQAQHCAVASQNHPPPPACPSTPNH
jgi:hypothetical protein